MIRLSPHAKLLLFLATILVLGCGSKDRESVDTDLADSALLDQMIGSSDVGLDMLVQESDMTEPLSDAHLSDMGVAQIPDMSAEVADTMVTEMTPDAEPPSLPGPCGDNEALTCAQLCETLTTCFSNSTCLGIGDGDQTALIEACVSNCAFNSSTRDILCQSEGDTCEVVLDRLFMADEALGTLCSGDFTPEDREGCAQICLRTSECTDGGNAMLETEQSCRFQCLLQGAASVSECIAELACDDTFEARVQSCLQGRETQPPLLTNCAELCTQLGNCQVPPFDAISASTTQETCLQDCAIRLVTSASVACAGRLTCGLTLPLTQVCVEENLDAPSCEIGCLRILECSQASNPFGASNDQLQQCTSDCAERSTLDERRCSFEASCNPDFLQNFSNCIEMSMQ
jgi:hypothetical protein